MPDEKKSWSADEFGKQIHEQIHKEVHERIHWDIARIRRGGGRGPAQGFLWGALFIAVGVILLLDHIGIVSAQEFFRYWPMLFVLAGIFNLQRPESRPWGIILILVGAALQLNKLGITHVRLWDLWPIVLIAIGVLIMWRSLEGKLRWRAPLGGAIGDSGESSDASGTVDVETVFGSNERRITAKNFQRGKLKAIFGEVKLDFRPADIDGDEAQIQADAVFGRVELRVPETWNVILRGSAVFGNYADQTRHSDVEDAGASNRKRLVVKGGAVFGEVEIKN